MLSAQVIPSHVITLSTQEEEGLNAGFIEVLMLGLFQGQVEVPEPWVSMVLARLQGDE